MLRTLIFIALSSMTALSVQADDAPLWKARRCDACHSIERKVVGPSFRDIAKRYQGNMAMAEPLAIKILNGGGGAWGAIPMAANKHVSESEARNLARWVLGLPY